MVFGTIWRYSNVGSGVPRANRGFDVRLAAYGENHAAHQPYHAWDLGNRNRGYYRAETASGKGYEGNCQEDSWNSHDAVHPSHNDAVSHADIAGDQADK